MSDTLIEAVARAMCKSRTFEGVSCCQWPAQMGTTHNCRAARGSYDDAARAAIAAIEASGTHRVVFVVATPARLSEEELYGRDGACSDLLAAAPKVIK